MAKIGTLKKSGTNAYSGKIQTLTINAEISLGACRNEKTGYEESITYKPSTRLFSL
jgi:uncharacterized protein (DUF736 family)